MRFNWKQKNFVSTKILQQYMWQDITESQKEQFNNIVTHPLQSYEWGEFRQATGITVIRKGFFENNKLTNAFQLTIHPIPHTPWTIGYLPKGTTPTKELIDELRKIGKAHNCISIQLEPNIVYESQLEKDFKLLGIFPAAHPLFTQYTFELDLTKSEEELLTNMHPKTRYNIRVAQKHGVEIVEENTANGFNTYWQLTKETTQRQGFYAHTRHYHELMWQTLNRRNTHGLQAHLFLANYKPTDQTKQIPLAAWVLFTFQDKLYYPYGASSSLYRNVMASNLMMWEAIRFGKKLRLKTFDMWGSMGESPDPKDPWYGFHRLKQGYGPKLVKFVGSYDLIINPVLYQGYKFADKLRWLLLKIKH